MSKKRKLPPAKKTHIKRVKPKSTEGVFITPLDEKMQIKGKHGTPVVRHLGYLFGPNCGEFADFVGLKSCWELTEGIYALSKSQWKKLKALKIPVVDLEAEKELRRQNNLPEVQI